MRVINTSRWPQPIGGGRLVAAGETRDVNSRTPEVARALDVGHLRAVAGRQRRTASPPAEPEPEPEPSSVDASEETA